MSAGPTATSTIPEVRVSVYAQRVLRRWYVVLLAVVVAIGVVRLNGVSSSRGQYEANAVVYMGNPLTPNGGAYQNPPYTTASAVSKLITSDASLGAAAKAAGVTVASLRGRVTSHLLATAATTTTGTKTNSGGTYYEITAQGSWGRRKAAVAVAVLASRLVDSANVYVNQKVTELDKLIATETTAIQTLQTANEQSRKLIDRLAPVAGSNASDAALLVGLLSQISDNTTAISDDQTQLSSNRLSRASALNIEAARVTTRPSGSTVTATNRRSSLAVAAFVGLLVGVGLALAWDALRSRPKVVAT
jgi:hypothetical protein